MRIMHNCKEGPPEEDAERGVCEREMEGVGIELLHPETFVLTRHLLPRVIKAGKI